MILVDIAGWVLFSCVAMSFIEHQVHRGLMHRGNPLAARFNVFKRMLEHHAVLHHGTYKHVFSDEPVAKDEDRGIRLNVREGFFETLPITLLIAIISIPGAIIFALVVCFHHYLWNKVHLEMHKPEPRGFSKLPAYKFLARHHFLHHKYPHRNFNVVFPLADYVLGTRAKASDSDVAEMYRIGLLTHPNTSSFPTSDVVAEPEKAAADIQTR